MTNITSLIHSRSTKVYFTNYKSTNRLGYSDNLVQNSTLECGLAMLLYYNTLNNMTMGSIARLFNDKQCKSIFVHITVGITTSVSQSSYRGNRSLSDKVDVRVNEAT